MEQIEKNDLAASQSNCECGCAKEGEVNTVDAVREDRRPRRAYAPAVDVVESEKDVTIVVDIPGVPENKVELSIEKNVLSLVAVPVDGVIAGKKLVYSEYGVGEYRRSFALSEDIDRESIKAAMANGVLRITLPKAAPVTKKIHITAE